MNRDEREQALWHDAYMLAMSQDPSPAESSCLADAAVAEFRKRYPAEPSTPPAVWYDEPPCVEGGTVHSCWMQGEDYPVLVAHFGDGWVYEARGRSNRWHPLAGRRVSPITKPQEPPQ